MTKPLGSALLAAWMRECKAIWFEPLIESMLISNGPARRIFADAGVTACTDVTGLASRALAEMLDASKVSRVCSSTGCLYDGFQDVVDKGIVSTLHRDNAKTACRVISSSPPAWLFDPQTSGGLIAGVKSDLVERTLNAFALAGCNHVMLIGEIIEMGPSEGPLIELSTS